MSRGTVKAILWTAVTLVAVGFVVSLWSGSSPAGSSTLSRGSTGWMGVRLWLEEEGEAVELLDRRPRHGWSEDLPAEGTLVIAFPWQRSARLGEHVARKDRAAETGAELRRRARAGGDLLVAYGGEDPGGAEGALLDALGMELRRVRGPAPLGPLAWWRHHREVWRLPAAGVAESHAGEATLRPLELPAPDWVPSMPEGARALYRAPAEEPGTVAPAVAFAFPLGAGRVAVVPASALANHALGTPGSGDLLATLGAWLRGPWLFDEYHHGLRAPSEMEATAESRALDVVLAHLLGLYLLGVWVLARRFGPPWREPPPLLGSTASFFRNLGRLHHELGHHGEGARLLVERRRALEPGRGLEGKVTPGPEPEAAGEVDAAGFLALARRLAEGRGRAPRANRDGRSE